MHRFFHFFTATIPAYGLFMTLGLCLGCALAIYRGKKLGIDSNDTLIIAATCICGVLLGGFGLYLFTAYGWKQLQQWILCRNFSFLTEGGLVFYGGLIGGLLFLPLGMIISGEKRIELIADAYVPSIPLGHGIGRIGCLFAGCCYGLPYDGIGSVRLTDAGIPHPVFPIQLLEAGLNFGLSFVLSYLSRKRPHGLCLLSIYFLYYGLERFILEFFRGDLIRGSAAGFSTSQWISFILMIVATTMLWLDRHRYGTLFGK